MKTPIFLFSPVAGCPIDAIPIVMVLSQWHVAANDEINNLNSQ